MAINEFKGEFRFLSSLYTDKPIRAPRGIVLSVEHGYQADKFVDEENRVKVLEAEDGKQAKKRSEALQKAGAEIWEDWDYRKLRSMREWTVAKFHPGTLLASRLVGTYPEELIEGNDWDDLYWGVDLETGVGENRLGILLMEIRTDLMDKVRRPVPPPPA
jgi:ribA/ribD-fused uncharacterized protein